MYYDKAALKCVNKELLKLDSLNFEALTFKSLVVIPTSFHEGAGIGKKKLRKLIPF